MVSSLFPVERSDLETFGLKFEAGGAHISRTMMLGELVDLLAAVPVGSIAEDYRVAVLQRNVLGKTTESTRMKSLRHLRELYALDESTPVFALLRTLDAIDGGASRALLALQVAWARDPLLRATTQAVIEAHVGEPVSPASLATAIEVAFPGRFSELNRNKIGRNAASSWTQSGHLVGRANKTRQHVTPSVVSVTLALFLGQLAGYHGGAVFSSPWLRLLDLGPERARSMAQESHRAGLLNLRAVGDVVELNFPTLDVFRGTPS